MKVRYHFIKQPKTTIYQTPTEAYMIINGIAETYRVQKQTRRRNAGSLSCQHFCKNKEIRVCKEYEAKNNSKMHRKHRLESHHGYHPDQRERMNQKSIEKYEERYDKQNDRYLLRQRTGHHHGKAISFRDLNAGSVGKKISCNYPKQIQKQNIELRKQNKFLQDYVKVLQMKTKEVSQNNGTKSTKFRNSGSFSGRKNSFGLKTMDNSQKNSEVGQFYSNKVQGGKGQNDWQNYHS